MEHKGGAAPHAPKAGATLLGLSALLRRHSQTQSDPVVAPRRSLRRCARQVRKAPQPAAWDTKSLAWEFGDKYLGPADRATTDTVRNERTISFLAWVDQRGGAFRAKGII